MGEVPSLITLCLHAVRNEILCGDDVPRDVYELPLDLFDSLMTCLPPLALHKLQEQTETLGCGAHDHGFAKSSDDNVEVESWVVRTGEVVRIRPFEYWDDGEYADGCFSNQRKRKRYSNLWRTLYKSRWPGRVSKKPTVNWLEGQNADGHESTSDWQQIYWEAHLQLCLDEAAEIALLPSFAGCIGEVRIPDAVLRPIGYEGHMNCSRSDYAKLSYHCQHFGPFASKLQRLELWWIKSLEQVEGVCKLLNQNTETLNSVEFVFCTLSSTIVDSICDSVYLKDVHTHTVEHFSIKTSSFLEANQLPFPVGLASFLSSARYVSSHFKLLAAWTSVIYFLFAWSLSSLRLSDNHLGQNFAKMVFSTLMDAESSMSVLDLSKNNISGWLSHFRWTSASCPQTSSGIGNSLQSLRMLNLRGNNLDEDDVACLKNALVHMPKLEILDISDNPLEDDGIMTLIPYFVEMSGKHSPFKDLKVESCELSCDAVSQLLSILSTFTEPLKSLSIGGNDLGSKVGPPLGKFLGTGIQALDIEDIDLGPSGFLKLQEGIVEDLKLVYLNISKNRGGNEAARFLTKLIPRAPELVAVNAGYNCMPSQSVLSICSVLKAARGELEHVDLIGNNFCSQSADALAEFQKNGNPIFFPSNTAFFKCSL